jgi:lysyl-tRNA synthetase class 2
MLSMAEADIRSERLKKLALLKSAGMDPYPVHAEPTATIREFLADFDARAKKGGTETLAGRVMSLRGQGGIMFADMFDGSTSLATGGTARVQLVLQQSEMDAKRFDLFANAVDTGDFLEATGTAFKTKRGERSLKVVEWKMLSKSLLPIPSEWYGLKDEEKILRERYLDILLNAETRAMFERKARFWQSVREFYLARGFLEVETPVLETSPGGADARPFVTHHNALDIEVYLRISVGELWQKRLLVAGYPKVFEIGRIFRNEGQSREHLQDYTQLESYEAYRDAEYGRSFVRDLYRHIVKTVYGKYTFEIGGHTVDLADEWPVMDFSETLEREFGIDPLSCSEEEAITAAKSAGVQFGLPALHAQAWQAGESPNKVRAVDHLWKQVRKSVAGPAFLTGVPVYLEPLAKRSVGNANTVDRFQVIVAGSEVGKGYSELNDPEDQRARFEEQQKLRDQGDEEAQRLDLEFVRALEYGMPPAFGFGVSERLFAFLENKPVHEAQIFPLLRPR